MELQSIGLAGLERAQERLAAVAKRLSGGAAANASASTAASAAYAAGGGGDTVAAGGGDVVDLSAEMVALLESKNLAQANLKIVETANEISSKTIDILG